MARINGDNMDKMANRVSEQSVFGVKITGAIYIYGLIAWTWKIHIDGSLPYFQRAYLNVVYTRAILIVYFLCRHFFHSLSLSLSLARRITLNGRGRKKMYKITTVFICHFFCQIMCASHSANTMNRQNRRFVVKRCSLAAAAAAVFVGNNNAVHILCTHATFIPCLSNSKNHLFRCHCSLMLSLFFLLI